MNVCSYVSFLLLCTCSVHGKPTVRKERVHHDTELTKRTHEDNQSYQYDHEAFLGKEEATTFDQLTQEESKERLG